MDADVTGISISINVGNEIFGPDSIGRNMEIARILRKLAENLLAGEDGTQNLYDINGNCVGVAAPY